MHTTGLRSNMPLAQIQLHKPSQHVYVPAHLFLQSACLAGTSCLGWATLDVYDSYSLSCNSYVNVP